MILRPPILAVALLAGLAAPLAAQGGPAPTEGADRNRTLAAKLAGLVGFANVACADVQGNPERLKATVRDMGIDPTELDAGELAATARGYLEAYRRDVPENCRRAIETFGPSSSLVPNLIVRR